MPRAKSSPPSPAARAPIARALDVTTHFPLRRMLGADAPLDVELGARLLTAMWRARALDDALVELQRDGRLGPWASGAGEEAIAVGAAAALESGDWLAPGPRAHGALLVRGVPAVDVAAAALGTAADPNLGRPGPTTPADRARRVLPAAGGVGSQLPHATGIGWAMRLRDESAAVLALAGDASRDGGELHVGLNFAGVLGARTVFALRSRVGDGRALGAAYGLPLERVDGSDALAVYAAARDALASARRGGGATVLELVLPDAAPDPIRRLADALTAAGGWDRERDEEARAEALEAARVAVDAALRAGPPPRETLIRDVFAG